MSDRLRSPTQTDRPVSSADLTRKVYLEHVVHLLFLPGIHSASSPSSLATSGSEPATVTNTSQYHHVDPRLPICGLRLSSPFHFSLRVTSRLSFNDAGRITYHRDLWDVKDLIQLLIPGSRLLLWFLTRLGGLLLYVLARIVHYFITFSNRRNERYGIIDVPDEDAGGSDTSGATVNQDSVLANGVRATALEEEAIDREGEAAADRYRATSTDFPAGGHHRRSRRSNGTSVDVP